MSETTKTTAATETAAIIKAAPQQLVLAVPEETITALDNAAANGVLAQSIASQFKKMFMLGGVMAELKKLLTPKVMEPIMQLQNSPIGFLTDRQQTGYDVDTVIGAVTEAAINGVNVCGNEFNILAGRFYLTKNGLKHKLRDIPGLYKNVTPGIPKMFGDNGAIVRMHIEWTYNGKSNAKDIDFAIRVNRGMGADAIIGKATRKAYAWLFEEVTGNSVPEGEAGDVVIMDTTATESPLEQEPQQPAAGANAAAPQGSNPAGQYAAGDELPM